MDNLSVAPIALLALAIALTTPSAAVDLKLKAEVVVARDHVVLGDLLERNTDSNLVNQAINTLLVVEQTASGGTLTLTRAMLARRLLLARPELKGKINWQGATSVVVHPASSAETDTQLNFVADAALRTYLAGRGYAFSIQPVTSDTRPMLPPGEFTFRAQALNERPLRKRMAVAVDAVRNGKTYRTIPVWFMVSATTDVLVAVANLTPHQALSHILFEQQSVDIATLAHTPVAPSNNLQQMRVRRSVARGSVLLASDVEHAPPIARNQDVALKVVAGSVTIETQATALSDATIGKSVRVKNSRSGEEFVANVVAPGMAEVLVR